jgi:hypothetical protein
MRLGRSHTGVVNKQTQQVGAMWETAHEPWRENRDHEWREDEADHSGDAIAYVRVCTQVV